MNTQSIPRAIFAGLVGTTVMTAIALMGPLMGMPEMKTGEMLGAFMGIPSIVGWMAHFMIGSVLAVIYVTLFQENLPGAPALKGALYGIAPWLVLQIMMSPMIGAGFFSLNTAAPALMLMGSLMGHLVYGAVVGAVYGRGASAAKEFHPLVKN